MSANIQYVLPRLEGRHGDVCALVNGIVNNALFHSSPQCQPDASANHSHHALILSCIW